MHEIFSIWPECIRFSMIGRRLVDSTCSKCVKGTLPPKTKCGLKRSKYCKTNQVAVKSSYILPFARNSIPKMVKPRFG